MPSRPASSPPLPQTLLKPGTERLSFSEHLVPLGVEAVEVHFSESGEKPLPALLFGGCIAPLIHRLILVKAERK